MKKRLFGLALLLLVAPVVATAAGGGDAEGGLNPFSGDLGNVLWTLITFGLVVFVLGKFAWKPILSGLKAREDFIHDSLAQAKDEREKAEALAKSYEDKLNSARAEATEIVEEGRRDAQAVKARIEEEARSESEKMLARARREIEIAKDTALKEIYTSAGALATDAASRIIRKELSPADHERLIQESIDRLGASSSN